jgi:pyridoxine/pyridoxamine 5'-phosphate oxidase
MIEKGKTYYTSIVIYWHKLDEQQVQIKGQI